MSREPRIPVVLGATASGKTSLGIELARLMDGEIISVDSRKVYRGLTVGTAAPEGRREGDVLWVDGIAHHLIGHLAPDEPYAAGDFADDAARLIDEILARGRRPILVGGTGFYFKALQQGLPQFPPKKEGIRARLEERVKAEGLTPLHEELRRKDPEAGREIRPSDKHKIMRALEVLESTGIPFSGWKNAPRVPSPHHFAIVAPLWPSGLLEKRIEERSRVMEKSGMIEETEAVLALGYAPSCPALASFGYREAVQVLRGELPRKEFLPRLIKGTKAYAKRQRTWFRTQVRPAWFDVNEKSDKKEIALKMKAFIDAGAK